MDIKILFYFFVYIFFLLLSSCQKVTIKDQHHSCYSSNDTLYITYNDTAHAVQFKMFEGLNFMLKKKSETSFYGAFVSQDLSDAIFSYDIIVYSLDSAKNYINLNYREKINEDNLFLFKGKNRKSTFYQAKTMNGKILIRKLENRYLAEPRQVSIYFPSKFDKNVSIIYLTDGSIVETYANYIDKLISDNIIKPVILVGVHSSEDYRYEEYVEGDENNSYFDKHREFFLKEVLNAVEPEIEKWCGKRYIYGFSNGAAFCMYMGLNYPDLFEEVIAFSTADYISEFNKPIEFKFKKYPKFYMRAGKFEESIYNDNERFSSKMKNQNINVQFKTFISGHDFNVWRYEFLEHLLKEFKYK